MNIKVPEDKICLFVESKKTSIGLVVMDSKGVLLHAHEFVIQFIGKSMIAKAIAIRKFIQKEK